MAEFSIELLGPPLLRQNGRELTISRNKSLGIAAYLADTGRAATREELADLFWPEAAAGRALASLRTALAELKSALGSDCLNAGNSLVSLNGEILSCDAEEFRLRIRDAETVPGMMEAESLWNGGFMKGFYIRNCSRFSDWQFLEEQNLTRDYGRLLRELSAKLINSNRLKDALSYSRKSLSLDPLDESIHRQIMSIHALSGDSKSALEQYSLCCRLIQDEFDFNPEDETVELADKIRDGSRRPGVHRLTPPSPAGQKKPRIAVLPFRCRTHGDKDDYFSDIISEAVHSRLAGIRGIDLISRTSVLSCSPAENNIPRIARDLKADYIIEGWIGRLEKQRLIDADLVDAARDSVVATGNISLDYYESDVQICADEITDKLLAAISVSPSKGSGNSSLNTALKLRAKHLLRNHDPASADMAVELYREAAALNSEDAEAWAGLANAIIYRGLEGMFGADIGKVHREAESAASRALLLDPAEPTALWIRGLLTVERDFDWKTAEMYYLKSLESSPDNPEVLENYAILLLTRNRLEEALKISDRACELDPVSRFTQGTRFWLYVALKKYRQALAVQHMVNRFFPDEIWTQYKNGFFHFLTGNIERGIAEIEPVIDKLIELGRAPVLGMLAWAYAETGQNKKARQLIELICRNRESFYGFHLPIAAALTALGDFDAAIDWIEKAVDSRDPGLMFLSATPFYIPLNREPGFIALVNKTGIIPQK